MLLGFRCGLRLGETYGLLWEDIDLEAGKLNVKRQVQILKDKAAGEERIFFSDPKYKSFRSIPLDSHMLEVLRRAKADQEQNRARYEELYYHYYEDENRELVSEPGPGRREVFFVNVRECGSYIQARTMTNISRVIHLNLGIKAFDYHSLRHSHATILLANGAPLKDVQNRLGHKSVKVTLDIYAHLTAEEEAVSLNILDKFPLPSTDKPEQALRANAAETDDAASAGTEKTAVDTHVNRRVSQGCQNHF